MVEWLIGSIRRECLDHVVVSGERHPPPSVGELRHLIHLLRERPTPERCVAAYHQQRTHFERIGERKLGQRQLTEDGNVEISGRICVRSWQ